MFLGQRDVELLNAGLQELGIEKRERTIQMFSIYLQELLLWNRKTNLIGTSETKEIIIRHVFDSLTVYHLLKSEKGSILDIGTGAGFPSIPLKIVDDSLRISAVERRKRRVWFLRNAVVLLGFEDFPILDCDVRDVKEEYDIILARGLGKLKVLYELTRRIVKEKSMIIAFKGKITEIEKEMSRLKESTNNDKGVNLHIQRVKVPYLDKEERNIVIIETK